MRSYTTKLSIAFISAMAFFIVVVVFFYTQLNNHFFETKAEESIWTINESIATRVNTALLYDYERLEEIVLTAINNGQNPLTVLNSQKEELSVRGLPYVGFGRVLLDSYEIDGVQYVLNDDFIRTDYFDENVAIYSFEKAFWDNSDDTVYVFFKVQQVFGYFEAYSYLVPLFEDVQNLTPYYAIMTKDGLIQFQKNEMERNDKYFDFLRREFYGEEYIQSLMDKLYERESFVERVTIFGESSFVAFHPLHEGFSSWDLYVVQQYTKKSVMGTMAFLSTILIATFVLIGGLFVGSLFAFYRLLETKNADIERSRLIHYYVKPYVIHISPSGKIRSFNRSFKRTFSNYKAFKHIYDFKVIDEYQNIDLVQSVRRQKSFTAVFHPGDKENYIRMIPVRYGFGYVLIGDDVTKFESMFIDYRSMALYNKVTKLPNMNFFRDKLSQLLGSPSAIQKKNSIVSFNIAGFKNINRLMGEKIGDRTLETLARLAEQSLLTFEHSLYNSEADNFIVLFENIESYAKVTEWANAFIEQMKRPVDIERNMLNLELKMGIFHMETDIYTNLTVDTAIENMTLALNRAKESLVYSVFTYDLGLGQYLTREQIMEADLAKAIENEEFIMYLQPQFHNVENRIVGFEALIRWNNPKYIMESPAHFIALAENNNMIIDIGKIAMDATFKIAKELEPYNVQLSINVSPVQILQAGFVNEIIAASERHELKKNSICIEITETFLMTSFTLIIEKLKLLQAFGFNIHLDDFGTGYSSMLYLKELPINTIKIDRNFIIYLNTDKYSRAIVSKIISLARNLDLEIIAEGVEDDKQNQFLMRSGCNIIQGHLISKAVSKEEAIQLILDYNVTGKKQVQSKKTKKKKDREEGETDESDADTDA